MGWSISFLLSPWNEILRSKIFDVMDTVEAAIARSLSFGSKDGEVMRRTFSFHADQELERSSRSDTRMLKTHAPLKGLVVVNKSNTDSEFLNEKDRESTNGPEPRFSLPNLDNGFSSPRPMGEFDAAAIKLQKVYKSYRTRRNLADCAVVVEELWWKTLDAAALARSSISFFNENEQETAASRWYRARRRAAKVGKGLLQDERAQKLALHHWLEAIDPRHRYGRNLHLYFDVWSDKKSFQPFFYWLDVGEGKEVDLSSCPRADLQRQCIQYLGPKERESYEVRIEEGKLVYKQTGILLSSDEDSKWIFVLSTSRVLYVGKKNKGVFQHSSFLSGGATKSAGRLIVANGILKALWRHSGHYLPTEDNFKEFISFLEEHHVDMTTVEICSSYDDENKPANEYDHLEAATDVTTTAEIHKGGMQINTENTDAPKLDLTKTLSRNWSSGVGPRIGCVRDYPMELQCQALEKVSLSPTVNFSPRYSKFSPPIPSPRPSPKIRVSPTLSNMGLPSPRVE